MEESYPYYQVEVLFVVLLLEPDNSQKSIIYNLKKKLLCFYY